MKKILIISIVLLSSISSVLAADTDPIAQTKALLDQYAARVKVLEAENSILREEMRKAGIQIPLDAFSGAIQTTTTIATTTSTANVATTNTGAVVSSTVISSVNIEIALGNLEKTYGTSYISFIRRIVSEWDKVRDAYAMPKTAYIGGYEFVDSGNLDHVFVDIMYTGSISGSGFYDAKILYQFDKTTFARKLIGLFEYDNKTGYYTTKTGKNLFPGVKRTWVEDPRANNTVAPSTVVSGSGSSSVVNAATTSTTTPSSTTTVSYSNIEAAYTAKRFLSVITLSNQWLTVNSPTLDVLRIRYRTYFIIAKYTEALAEIEKITSIGQMSSAVACEGYVIATYAKNTTLADKYKTICNKK